MSDCINMVAEHKVFELNDQVVSIEMNDQVVSIEFSGAIPGPPGPPGPPGGSVIQVVAGQNISSGRAVVLENGEAFYFNPANASHSGRVVGIADTAANIGDELDVQLSGLFTNPGLGLTQDLPVFAGPFGVLTNSPPIGLVQCVGVASGADEVYIQIKLTLQT